MTIKLFYIYCVLFLILASLIRVYGQESANTLSNKSEEITNGKRHFISINPIKPFIGLPNLNYEFQFRKKIGITAFSEVLAYTVIPDFKHPDAVSTVGFSFYPFMDSQTTNQGVFININTSYVVYFRDKTTANSFANGIQIGYKWLFKGNVFLEPKLVLNYTYEDKSVMPGLELLLGLNL